MHVNLGDFVRRQEDHNFPPDGANSFQALYELSSENHNYGPLQKIVILFNVSLVIMF